MAFSRLPRPLRIHRLLCLLDSMLSITNAHFPEHESSSSYPSWMSHRPDNWDPLPF
ncbi:hypothetical protein PILCRDRAFT_815828 [Piloderma croceum F 1598]|uniref:Uncharacterized protein n=1 Tax=Piloderma croceum (strain F 1598) TaxID=765440 RepID=A0A0C3G7H1_PILCF|nr:hypothetical protein PILCRDRAFT_815828 [Piloderma croceum F 1598]